ncbi:MAG TPA: NAD(P)/FAD-dependent oxidoreductase [Mycobacteriales bacterium]|nr:NAD(P)/FAD-dependent oxidoreductase [Mycobacteriales bacterium]
MSKVVVLAGRRRRHTPAGPDAPHVLIVGAGFAGFHCARELERRLAPGEARVTLASPTDYMLYSPLLPHVAAGILDPADIALPLRRSLHRTVRAPCWIVGIDLADRVCVARTILGEEHAVRWDRLVLCPGAVSRTFSIPGLTRYGRGMKTLAEASYLHDHVLAELELGNVTTDPRARAAHCTFVVVGAGYAGVETAATLHALTQHALRRFLNLRPEHLRWILVDVAPHVLPELGETLGAAALRLLRQRGIEVRLQTSIGNVTEDAVQLSDGETVACRTLAWTAGVTASPLLASLGLETGRAGRLVVTPELQVPQHEAVFAGGDAAAVPDLTEPDATITPPTAQHAQRQGVTLARNVIRSLRGQRMQPYRHRDLGLVVDLGGTRSVARPLGRDLTGLPAQLVTRGYHLSALPSMRSRTKAAVDWLTHAALGDDFVRVGLTDTGDGTLGAVAAQIHYLTLDAVRSSVGGLSDAPG